MVNETIYVYEKKCRMCPKMVRSAILVTLEGKTKQFHEFSETQKKHVVSLGIDIKMVTGKDGKMMARVVCSLCKTIPIDLNFRDLKDFNIEPNIVITYDENGKLIEQTFIHAFK